MAGIFCKKMAYAAYGTIATVSTLPQLADNAHYPDFFASDLVHSRRSGTCFGKQRHAFAHALANADGPCFRASVGNGFTETAQHRNSVLPRGLMVLGQRPHWEVSGLRQKKVPLRVPDFTRHIGNATFSVAGDARRAEEADDPRGLSTFGGGLV